MVAEWFVILGQIAYLVIEIVKALLASPLGTMFHNWYKENPIELPKRNTNHQEK